MTWLPSLTCHVVMVARQFVNRFEENLRLNSTRHRTKGHLKMGIWEDIEALPPDELYRLMQRLMRSESRLGQRVAYVVINRMLALKRRETPPSFEALNAQFDAREGINVLAFRRPLG
jgi:hypothetical protein